MRRLITLFSLLILTLPLWSANCSAGGAKIYFGNGVMNTFDDAVISSWLLEQAVKSQIGQSKSIDQACLSFDVAYDSEFLNSSGVPQKIIDAALQIAVSSGLQKTAELVAKIWMWFSNTIGAPTWFDQGVQNVLTTATVIFQPDLQTQLSGYNNDISAGNKSIVVAHSQGNLYANEAYNKLQPTPVQFNLISVATPADHVAGGGPYVTLTNDIITLVPTSLGANINNNPAPGAPCSSPVNLFTRLACHAFDTSYLPGINSGPAIVSHVIDAIPIVVGLSKLGTGKGTVTSLPNGLDCDSTCTTMQAAFPNSTHVTLTAAPAPGSIFKTWSGDCANLATSGGGNQLTIGFPVVFDATGSVIASYPESCTATFDLGGILTVTKSGTGIGTVSSVPAGINCGPTCMAPFPASPPVLLTAMAAAGSTFTGWGGDCASAGMNATAQVTLDANKTCDAKFDGGGILTVTKSGTGTGTVSSVPAGINCGPTCMASFPATPPVQLTATPAAGSIFTGWGGDCASAGTNSTAQVTVNANKTCDAKFDLGGILSITKSGTGTGTVSSVPAGISCGPTCMAPFPASPPVQLTAMAAAGSTFIGWSGDCTGMAVTTMVSVTANKTCTAMFGGSLPAVRLNPFGNQNGTVPYNVQVVDTTLIVTPAPANITVTLLREVFSECSGLLFSSNRTVMVSQGQSSATFNFDAGHDPACNTLPITTVYTVTQAVLAPSSVLDLSIVPPQQLMLFSIH